MYSYWISGQRSTQVLSSREQRPWVVPAVSHMLHVLSILTSTLLEMGCYSAPPPPACTGRGCYITPRGIIECYLGVIEYYLGAADVRTSAILTSYTLQICNYTPQISPLTFGTIWFSTAIRPIQASMHHPS